MNSSASLPPVWNRPLPEVAKLVDSLGYILADTAHLRELCGDRCLPASTRLDCLSFWLDVLEDDLATMELDMKRLENCLPNREPALTSQADSPHPLEDLAA